jgi:hypothetical protein
MFQHLEVRPGGGPPSSVVRMGERLRLEIAVDGLRDVDEPFVVISVGAPGVPVVFRMTSRMVSLKASGQRQARETIVLDIPSLPLTTGEYHIEAQIKDRTKTIDYLNPAAQFTVIGADVLGNGYQFGAQNGMNEGYVVVPWEWEVRPSDQDAVTSRV